MNSQYSLYVNFFRCQRERLKLEYGDSADMLPDLYFMQDGWQMTPSLVTTSNGRRRYLHWLQWISRYNYVTNTPGMFSRASMKAYNSLDAYIQV